MDAEMRDQNRGKHELLDDVTGLRKQVADLKQSQLERRRIEDGLRKSEEELRTLLDSAPVGMCLMSGAGEPLLANIRMAKLLGYSSPNELVRLGGTIGVIDDEAGKGWLQDVAGGTAAGQTAIRFRRLDGSVITLWVVGERREGASAVALAVMVREREPGS